MQKQSSYAVVLSDEVPLLCRIECFIRWTACDQRCAPACAVYVPRFLCITRQYEIIPWEVHYIPNVDMHLCKVTPTDMIGAFPVECLRMPCFYINSAGHDTNILQSLLICWKLNNHSAAVYAYISDT